MADVRGKTEIYRCLSCRDPFRARVADRNRGWARFCSKSCKAIRQTQLTGYSGPSRGGDWDGQGRTTIHPFSQEAFDE